MIYPAFKQSKMMSYVIKFKAAHSLPLYLREYSCIQSKLWSDSQIIEFP